MSKNNSNASLNVSVIEFPNSSGVEELDLVFAETLGIKINKIWHTTETLDQPDLLILGGGFSFSDYLRPGALAKTTRVAPEIRRLASHGCPILGIGNGFQILCELSLLPGALITNPSRSLLNQNAFIKLENHSPFTEGLPLGTLLSVPICCYTGCYYIDSRGTLELEESQQIIFRYTDDEGTISENRPFNGCTKSIAAVCNKGRNILGMMVRPERAVDEMFGSTTSCLQFWASVIAAIC